MQHPDYFSINLAIHGNDESFPIKSWVVHCLIKIASDAFSFLGLYGTLATLGCALRIKVLEIQCI